MAEKFIKEGASVIISSRSEGELKEVGKELGCDCFVADVTVEQQMEGLVNYALKKFGSLDIWVNNAGIHSCHYHLFK